MEALNNYSKWKSRTFLFALIWTFFVPLGIVAAIILAKYDINTAWLTPLVTSSGAITTAFVAMEKLRKAKRESKNA